MAFAIRKTAAKESESSTHVYIIAAVDEKVTESIFRFQLRYEAEHSCEGDLRVFTRIATIFQERIE